MTDSCIRLRYGRLHATLLPDLGGCCASLRYQRAGHLPVELLRPLRPGCTDPFASSCFVMVPYSNRLFNGALISRRGGARTISANREGIDVPVHGVGWAKRWTIREQAKHTATLAYVHTADRHWPHAHTCGLTVTLGPRSARFDLALQNLSDESMPAGLGFHPYLMLEADALLRFDAQAVWNQDKQGLPCERTPVAGHEVLDFGEPRLAAAVQLNHCFTRWAGLAELQRPRHGLTARVIADAALAHLVVYRPDAQPWICVEPVSHASGAFSLEALHGRTHGLRWLAPRRSVRVSMEVRVIDSLT